MREAQAGTPSGPLRWGIVGLGTIVWTTMAAAMVAEPACELIAGASRDPVKAQKFAGRFGARRTYRDYHAMLADPEVDAVYIATPNALHAEQAIAAARAGKHVLCDKPMALSVADARRVVEECAQAGVRLGVLFHYRQLAWVQDTARLIASGAIGDVLTVQVEASAGLSPPDGWRDDPALAGLGTIYSQGVHVYDVLRVLLASEPEEVAAMVDAGGRYAVETHALVLLRFASGALAYVNANQASPHPQNDLAIYGTAGRVSGAGFTRSRIAGELRVLTDSGETVTPYPAPGAHRRALAAFTQAVLEGRDPNPSGLDGLHSALVCEAIATAITERRTVAVGQA